MRICAGSAVIEVFAVCLLSVSALAQEQTFASRANLVTVPTLVNKHGEVVYGLRAEDFLVEDDGIGQLVELDEAAESQPLSLMIAVQRGRRAGREFTRMRGLASMLDPILANPDNEAAVLVFDSKLELVQDFTHQADSVLSALGNLRSGDRGATILDAVAYSVRVLGRRSEGRRRALLLISETRDHGSHFAKQDDCVRLIGASNTAVYALAFSPYLSRQLDTARGTNHDEWSPNIDLIEKLAALKEALRRNTPGTLAALTGGEYQIFLTRGRFETDLNSFANHLDSRYLLSFEPRDPHPGLRRIQVRLRQSDPSQTLSYRRNYWAERTPEY